jgi:N-acetylglucosamine-6-sulfatase
MTRPNILFIMTDDQPKDTMLAMPKVRGRIAALGMTFSHAYVSTSSCAPSRASMLRGQYSHNTGVLRNGPPDGGVQAFRANGLEDNHVAHWLRAQDYDTALVGKYMNGYKAHYKPSGWNYWYARADASATGKKVNDNGVIRDLAGTPYTFTDIFRARAMEYLDTRTGQGTRPFALFFWPGQPHLRAGDYASRYEHLYADATLNWDAAHDEDDVSDKPSWVRNLDRITNQQRAQLRRWRRNQLRCCRQVDDAVDLLLDKLRRRNELANTFVFFTTDNGVHMGEHRYWSSRGAKGTAYEEAANVLLIVRGPGVRQGTDEARLVLNNDLAPTLVRIAGGVQPGFCDGRSILPLLERRPGTNWRTAVLNERPKRDGGAPDPYHAIVTGRATYVEYVNGEREFYDRSADPMQLMSKPNDPRIGPLAVRLRGLRECSGNDCGVAENGG